MGGPLPGARISLAGTSYAATTDSAGRFLMTDVPEGAYEIRYSHPELDRLKLHPAAESLTVVRGEASRVELVLAANARADAITRMCAEDPDHVGDNTGILWGRIADETTGATVAGATLEVNWRRIAGRPDEQRPDQISVAGLMLSQESVVVETDAIGSFLICGLPSTSRLDVRARHAGRQSAFLTVGPLGHEGIEDRVFMLPAQAVP
jgi:hypothetical protein